MAQSNASRETTSEVGGNSSLRNKLMDKLGVGKAPNSTLEEQAAKMRSALHEILGEDDSSIIHEFCVALLVEGLVPVSREHELYGLCTAYASKVRAEFDERFELAGAGVFLRPRPVKGAKKLKLE